MMTWDKSGRVRFEIRCDNAIIAHFPLAEDRGHMTCFRKRKEGCLFLASS